MEGVEGAGKIVSDEGSVEVADLVLRGDHKPLRIEEILPAPSSAIPAIQTAVSAAVLALEDRFDEHEHLPRVVERL